MSIKNRLKKLQDKQSKFENVVVTVMEKMSWSWSETMETPISSFLIVLDELNKNAKREQERNKK